MSRTLPRTFVLVVVGLALQVDLVAAASKVDIVLGRSAPKLEQFAAEQIAEQLGKLYGAQAAISLNVPPGDAPLVLVGSPATNPTVKAAVGGDWPELTDQGHCLRSTEIQGRPALIVGGGSPVATLWAAYELGHRLGIRYLLSGDVYPATPGELLTTGFDVILEPSLRTRTWRTINDFAIGPESWGHDDQRRLIGQLAKLKFNRVLLSVYPWQPFVDYEFGGVRKSTAVLFYGHRYRVDGDTPGRKAFQGAREFINPDFADKETYEERTKVGIALARRIMFAAHELGMTVGLCVSPLDFPHEFAEVLPGAKPVPSPEPLAIGPGAQQSPDDATLRDLAATQLRAYLRTYPQLDAIYLTLPEFPDWNEHAEAAWQRLADRNNLSDAVTLEQLTAAARDRGTIAHGDRGVQALRGNLVALDFLQTLLADGTLVARDGRDSIETHLVQVDPALYPLLDQLLPPDTGTLHLVDYTARRVLQNDALLAQVPAGKVTSDLILTLADDNVGVLPQLATHDLHELTGRLRAAGWNGFSTRYWIPGDLDTTVQYLSRAAFDDTDFITPESTLEDLVTPMCGPGVTERLALGLGHIERATALIDERDIGFAFPVPGMIMKHYIAAPAPEWWPQATELYTQAMNEMYRSHDRSQPGGRPFLRYYAKRAEFALEYLNCVQAVRAAALAREAGDRDEQLTQLEKAVESLYNGLNAYSEMARDNSDRGVIAVVNEYGYRPLLEEFQRVEEEE
jgi:hypothetical protein